MRDLIWICIPDVHDLLCGFLFCFFLSLWMVRRERCTSFMESWINRSPRWSSWTCPGSTQECRECWCCAPTRPHPRCLRMCRLWMSWRQMSSYQIKRPPTGASYKRCLKTCPRTTLLWYKCQKIETINRVYLHAVEWVFQMEMVHRQLLLLSVYQLGQTKQEAHCHGWREKH